MEQARFIDLPIGARFKCNEKTFMKTSNEDYPITIPLNRRRYNSICIENGHRVVFGTMVMVEVLK